MFTFWGCLRRYGTTYDPDIGQVDPASEQEDGLGELSSIYCGFCDTGPKRSLGFLGSKPLLGWVGTSYHFFHKLMKLRDILWGQHSWGNLQVFCPPRQDCTCYRLSFDSFSTASRNTHEELKIQKLHQHGNDYLQIHRQQLLSALHQSQPRARRTNSGEIHLSSTLATPKQPKQLLQAYFCPQEHNAANSPGCSSLQPKQADGNFGAATLFLQVNY